MNEPDATDASALLEELRARLAATPFYGWAGLSLESASPGEVVVGLTVEPHHLNIQGIVHGGMIATLADTAAGLAVRSKTGVGRRQVTAQLNVNFLAPAQSGRVLARGTVVRLGMSVAYAEAEVTGERGRVLATATSVLSVMPERS